MSLEASIQGQIRVGVGALPGVRLFRNNIGVGWQGEVREHTAGRLVMLNPRPLHAGLFVGSPDLVGWRSLTVRPEHVGRVLAVFTGLEVKAPGRNPTPAQRQFLAAIIDAGGLAGVAHNTPEALSILGGLGGL